MKKITLLLAMAVAVVFSASAQKNATQVSQIFGAKNEFNIASSNAKTTSYDTIWPTSIANGCDSLRLYSTQGGTYVTGNNEYGDLEKGTLVKYVGNGTLTSVEAILWRAGTVGTGTCKVNVYSKGTDLLPGTLLGSSDVVSVSDLTVDNVGLYSFNFSTPVSVTGDFFTTIVLPTTTGDTIAVTSTSQYCTPQNGDSLSVEKWSDGTFSYMKTAWSGLNIDLFMAATVTTVTGIANATIDNINVFSSNNEIVIENNNKSMIKQVSVYNTLGQEVKKYDVNSNETTKLSFDLAASNYIVKVITDTKVGSYKLYIR